MLFLGVPGINKPGDAERMEEYMRELSASRSTDFRITITPQARYSHDHARVSWVRTGYLAAFELLGWRYILQPALQPIRDQLMNPSAVTLPSLSMCIPDSEADRRELWLVREPARLQSLLVMAGQHGVFLPLPNDHRTLSELASSVGPGTDGPVKLAVTGGVFPWPAGPTHLLDPAPVTALQLARYLLATFSALARRLLTSAPRRGSSPARLAASRAAFRSASDNLTESTYVRFCPLGERRFPPRAWCSMRHITFPPSRTRDHQYIRGAFENGSPHGGRPAPGPDAKYDLFTSGSERCELQSDETLEGASASARPAVPAAGTWQIELTSPRGAKDMAMRLATSYTPAPQLCPPAVDLRRYQGS